MTALTTSELIERLEAAASAFGGVSVIDYPALLSLAASRLADLERSLAGAEGVIERVAGARLDHDPWEDKVTLATIIGLARAFLNRSKDTGGAT